MVEFWLPQSLSRWNSGYHGAFLKLSRFLSHDGIRLSQSLSQTFTISFSRWNSGYHGAFLKLSQFLSHDGIQAIMEPFSSFHDFFLTMEFTRHIIWGKTLFIYITKSIYIGSASFKTLPLDLEPPLQGKEYGSPYSKLSLKK
jgi:hypothetical protein